MLNERASQLRAAEMALGLPAAHAQLSRGRQEQLICAAKRAAIDVLTNDGRAHVREQVLQAQAALTQQLRLLSTEAAEAATWCLRRQQVLGEKKLN